jgi:hypothetical protein
MAANNKAHRAENGVDAPTRNAWRNIRRNARRKGISEEQAYSEWLGRQQRRRPAPLPAPNFGYSAAPPRPKASPTEGAARRTNEVVAPRTDEEVARDEADAPLHDYARARKLRLYRQFNGMYYFINLEVGHTMIRNPDNFRHDFTRDEVILYLGQLPEQASITPQRRQQ